MKRMFLVLLAIVFFSSLCFAAPKPAAPVKKAAPKQAVVVKPVAQVDQVAPAQATPADQVTSNPAAPSASEDTKKKAE